MMMMMMDSIDNMQPMIGSLSFIDDLSGSLSTPAAAAVASAATGSGHTTTGSQGINNNTQNQGASEGNIEGPTSVFINYDANLFSTSSCWPPSTNSSPPTLNPTSIN